MNKTTKITTGTGARLLLTAGVASIALSLLSTAAVAQPARPGAIQPAAHADQEPINHLPNPYETQRNFGTLPDGRSWGSVSVVVQTPVPHPMLTRLLSWIQMAM